MKLKFKLLLVLTLLLTEVFAAKLPVGFKELVLAENLNPATMALAPDGRLFLAMKDGRVLVVRDDVLQPDPYLTIAVDNFNERGLSGIAIHPDYETNQLIYVYYTVPGENHNRISTFQGNGDFAIPGSENILLDLDPMAGTIHNGGAMKFGTDGKLYVAVGDGAQSSTAQDMNSLLGKFLRLNDDGTIPTDNPFYHTNTGSNRAIWALGFRNPFTFDIQPGTGRIFSNDVGGSDFEEVNEVQAGMNYGWPIIEGFRTTQTPPVNYQDPKYAYPHSLGCSVIGAAFYDPQTVSFPSAYVGNYFFADYCEGYIKVLDPDDGSIIETFATEIDRPIAMTITETGEMYYLERAGLGGGSMQDNTTTTNGRLWKISYTGSGEPSVTRQPESQLVSVGEDALFSLGVSGNEPLTFQWQRDGVDIFDANEPSYTHVNAVLADDGAFFRCVVSNAEATITSDDAVLQVTSNSRPVPIISQPGTEFLYQAGKNINFAGSATDEEDGVLEHSQLTWWIDFHHDEHSHPGLSPISGIASSSYQVPRVGETSYNVWFRIYLRATDSEGLSKVVYQDVYPLKSEIEISSSTPGLSVNIDGKLYTTPVTITSVVGVTRTLEVPVIQLDDDNYYVFQQWQDGSTASLYTFDTPQENFAVIANYETTPLGSGDGLLGRYFTDQDQTFDGAVSLQRIDPIIDFNWVNGSPDAGISSDFFTARWMGFVQPLFSADYTFYTVSDDGVRLWVDNQLIIDKWIPQARTEWSGNISLQGGVNYPIKLEYYEQQGEALMELWWGNAITGKQLIPSSQLLRPDLVLGVNDPLNEDDFKVFPVPAQDELQIRLDADNSTFISLFIYDIMGHQIWSSEASPGRNHLQWKVDLSDWKTGTYLVRLITKKGTGVRYLIKL